MLEQAYNQQLQALLRPLGHEAYLFQCGVVFALERAATLLDDLQTVRQPNARPQPVSDARHVLNSPWYAAYRATQAR